MANTMVSPFRSPRRLTFAAVGGNDRHAHRGPDLLTDQGLAEVSDDPGDTERSPALVGAAKTLPSRPLAPGRLSPSRCPDTSGPVPVSVCTVVLATVNSFGDLDQRPGAVGRSGHLLIFRSRRRSTTGVWYRQQGASVGQDRLLVSGRRLPTTWWCRRSPTIRSRPTIRRGRHRQRSHA